MAVIHHTTMNPTKLELLASWLPTQPWYTGSEPSLTIAGGFRLDDPAGEVGIELMAVTDESGERPVSYLVPLAYRGVPLDGGDSALIGTTEHGVLGKRWVYDGPHDPVVAAQLPALLEGSAEPQAQSETDTPDASVSVRTGDAPGASMTGTAAVTSGPYGTRLTVDTTAGPGTVHIARVLRPEREASAPDTGGDGAHVVAGWRLPDGTEERGVFFSFHGSAT